MAVKQFKVDIVTSPVLRLRATVFDPTSFSSREFEKLVPLEGLSLSEPVHGPHGGFRSADLVDADGTVQWSFGVSEQAFYDAVKAALKRKP